MKSLALLLLATASAPGAAPPNLNLQVSTETAPAGGWVQIKIYASSPASIGSAYLALDLDPAVFTAVTRAIAFSSAGDAVGYAQTGGLHVAATISSASGSIGQTAGLPVLAIWASVYVGAQAGATSPLTVDPTTATASDANQKPYAVTVAPGQFTVGGSLSVEDVVPGGGLVGPGTMLRMTGSGFDAGTAVTVDGIKLASLNRINSTEIDTTLDASNAPTELTGKRIHFSNAAGEQTDYFPSLPSANFTLPFATFSTGYLTAIPEGSYVGQDLILLNQTSASVTVELYPVAGPTAPNFTQQTIVIPAGTLYIRDIDRTMLVGMQQLYLAASAPIRILSLDALVPFEGGVAPIILSGLVPIAVPPPIQAQLSTSTASWSWAAGPSEPAPVPVQIGGDLPFTVSVSGGSWLTVSPSTGTAPATLSLIPNVVAIGPGTYSATVTVTPILPADLPNLQALPATIKASLTVSSGALLSADSVSWTESSSFASIPNNPVTAWVYSNGGPTPFTVALDPGNDFFTVTPLSGTTPAILTFTAQKLGAGGGDVTIQGPNNTLTMPVSALVTGPPVNLPPATFAANPGNLTFVFSSASGPAQTQTLTVQPASLAQQATAQTRSGGNWLSVSLADASTGTLNVTTMAANLAPGTYYGTIAFTVPGQASPFEISVGLLVYSPQTVLNATVTGNTVSVVSSDVPVYFTEEGATAPGGSAGGTMVTPQTLQLVASPHLPPGVYRWNVVLHWDKGDTIVPVSATVPAPPTVTPSLGILISATNAYVQPLTLSPGEIMSLYGQGLGTATAGLTLGPDGKVATQLAGTSVLVGGFAAPLLYVSPTQVNFVVPYELTGSTTAPVQVVTAGGSFASAPYPIAEAAPALFTAGSLGGGQAAVLNQDNSVNSAANPAARGSVIQIYATGEGQTSPPGVTGSVTAAPPPTPVLPVSVTIGGVNAPVQFAGSAPGAVAGLFQVNVLLPSNVPVSSQVPIVITVGNLESPTGTVIAVR